jgi:hypothetical protein
VVTVEGVRVAVRSNALAIDGIDELLKVFVAYSVVRAHHPGQANDGSVVPIGG